jgi:hypothetical protein
VFFVRYKLTKICTCLSHEDIYEEQKYCSNLQFGTRLSLVLGPYLASLTADKGPTTPIEWEAGWSQRRCGRCGEEKILMFLPGFESRIIKPVAYSLYQIHCSGSDIRLNN